MSNMWEDIWYDVCDSVDVFHELIDICNIEIKGIEQFVKLHKRYCELFFESLGYDYTYKPVKTSDFCTLERTRETLFSALSKTEIKSKVVDALRTDIDDTDADDVFSLVYYLLTGGLILFLEDCAKGAEFLSGMLYIMLANDKVVHPIHSLEDSLTKFKNVFGKYRSISRITLETFSCLDITDTKDLIDSTFINTVEDTEVVQSSFTEFLQSIYDKKGMSKVAEIICYTVPKCTAESLQRDVGKAVMNVYNSL